MEYWGGKVRKKKGLDWQNLKQVSSRSLALSLSPSVCVSLFLEGAKLNKSKDSIGGASSWTSTCSRPGSRARQHSLCALTKWYVAGRRKKAVRFAIVPCLVLAANRSIPLTLDDMFPPPQPTNHSSGLPRCQVDNSPRRRGGRSTSQFGRKKKKTETTINHLQSRAEEPRLDRARRLWWL